MVRHALLVGAVVAALGRATTSVGAVDTFDTKAVDFAVSFHGQPSGYRDVAGFVMPRETLTIDAVGGPPGDYTIKTDDGELVQLAPRKWKWTAPSSPRSATLHVDGPASKDVMTVHMFVMVPASQVKNGVLNGYRIGEYPAKPLKGDPS